MTSPSRDAPAGWTMWDWPYFSDEHHELAARLGGEPGGYVAEARSVEELHREARALVRDLGAEGLLDIVVPLPDASGRRRIDVRSLCLVREALGYRHVLADTMFAMQGIGTAMLWMAGTAAQRDRYLEPCRRGETIAAFALSEPEAGSDVAAMTTTAVRDGDTYVINGEKTWISNAGIADHYIVVARTGEAPGARGLTALMVDADTPGLEIGPAIDMIVPHPLASLRFTDCRVPTAAVIGDPGEGFKAAMATFDIFRASVGAAAVGMARRAFDETLTHVRSRSLFGRPMSGVEGVQSALADMATDIETAALTVYRAAWMIDVRGGRCSREVSMAKLVGSEAAQRVVDRAVQLFGGRGIRKGYVVEKLYREVRGTRIYEGASEVQKLIIARSLLRDAPR